ncbi:DUF397 domain-containing protein [Streptomyces huiliensis]|uniref:DUF397 domain-containing protein n=1 Tax=Streptomyces huiliensis TaxID=2876027 RepID=UPI001CBE410B|nr:DUF397 domain-containing protein [Streptomyces huiliensis]MBZ4322937.1 DUF397 domain-containing protein [Streptomyces huiliensis]
MRNTTFDLSVAAWRKSSHSYNDGSCVEIAEQFPDILPIRDSKAPERQPITVPRTAWASFVTAIAATGGEPLPARGR